MRNGFAAALGEAERLRCGTFQMFAQNPRGWRSRVYTAEEFRSFRSARAASGIGRVVVHAPYLPNLCTSNPALYDRSVDCLKADLGRCEALGADFLVIHPGAYSPESDTICGTDNLIRALNGVFADVPGETMILIENMAGGGRRLGAPFEEIRAMLAGVRQTERAGVCFDTCHALAAGFDFRTKAGAAEMWGAFDREIGLDRLKVFHVNDSKDPAGSRRDRHQHLGEGSIGLDGFRQLFGAGDFGGRSFILETPKESPADDPRNLAALDRILTDVYGPAPAR